MQYIIRRPLHCHGDPRRRQDSSCHAGSPHAASQKTGWLWDHGSSRSAPSIRHQLKQQRFKWKKSLGQNFMEDGEVLERIVREANVREDSLVVEVGPGTGALTRRILATGARVRAVEKDDRLFWYLHKTIQEHGHLGDGIVTAKEENTAGEDRDVGMDNRMDDRMSDGTDADSAMDETGSPPRQVRSEDGRLEIVHGDVLKLDLAAFAEFEDPSGTAGHTKASLLANLPYNITRDFLQRALPLGDTFSSLVLMLQHEAAERLVTSTPNSPDWRAMNVIVQYYSSPSYLFRVDRRKYSPVPKVDGAVVDFALKDASQRPEVPSEKEFIALVKRGFMQRRKLLSNSLRPLLEGPEIQECLVSCGLPADARAQELSLDDFVALSWAVHRCASAR
jgi:16S rRNA (adenine1518-N6/adenine1519-N6)-dimethyltransferase